MMGGPPKQMLGSKLEGTELRAVVRWKGADPRTRANRDPWKWDEHGLAMASPRRASDSQWRSLRQRREELRQRREAGASHADAAPHSLVTEDVIAQNPGLSEDQLRRAASYCGCSRRRFDAYLEEFSRQDVTEGKYDWGESVSSIVEEYCVEQEELVATGRYVREAEPTRTTNRRRRKPLLITRAASEAASSTDSDQEQTDNLEDCVVEQTVLAPAPGDRPCTPLAGLGESSWPGTERCVKGGLLVLGDDGEPESYHALKHPENATELSPAGDQASASEVSSDSFSDDEQSDALSGRLSGGETLEAELEELAEKQDENGGAGDDTAGRPVSPIKAYLRLERRRPTTSAHARHDHVKAEAAFAQLRAQLAGLKQRPQTCPLSPAAAADPAVVPTRAAEAATQLETANECAHANAVARKSVSRAGGMLASFGGMPASYTVGSYRRGRAGTGSPTAGVGDGGGGVDFVSGAGSSGKGSSAGETALLGVDFSPSSHFVAKITGRDASRPQGNVATPPSSPPKPQVATATAGNAARGNAAGCISLDPVYRPLATRTTSGGGAAAQSQSAALPAATSWMSISAPSLPFSSAVAVDMHARIAGSYPQPEQSMRLVRPTLRGALSRQRRAIGAAAQNAMTVRKMREGGGLSRELNRSRLAVVAGVTF